MDIERRYYAFWNYGATSGELEYWCDNTGLLWLYSDKNISAEDKLYKAFVYGALQEILNKGHTKGYNPLSLAWDIAEERIALIDYVNWYSPDFQAELYGMGDRVNAERDSGNFDCDVLGDIVNRTASHKGIKKEDLELDSEE